MNAAQNLDQGIHEMKKVIENCMSKNPKIYWKDLILNASIAWLTILTLFFIEDYLILPILLISSLFVYRSIVFIHELAHLKENDVKYFNTVWHLIIGIPFLTPLFLYRQIHLTHHSKKHYSTSLDAEYYPFGLSKKSIFFHFIYNTIIPFLSIVRFSILTPISYLNIKFRNTILNHFSFMGLKYQFNRSELSVKNDSKYKLVEFLCFIYTFLIFTLIMNKILPIQFIYYYYFIMTMTLTLNSIRAMGSTHFYKFNGIEVNHESQMLDSINIRSENILTKIICPLGLQFHGLHHLFPSIPYHNLKFAFNILNISFPNHPYLKNTTFDSVYIGFKHVFNEKNKMD